MRAKDIAWRMNLVFYIVGVIITYFVIRNGGPLIIIAMAGIITITCGIYSTIWKI